METYYQIVVQMKTLNGMLEIGQFLIGNDRDFAFETFNSLGGKTIPETTLPLKLELVEKQSDLDLVIESINCNLGELAENCKIITRDAFKFFNFEM